MSQAAEISDILAKCGTIPIEPPVLQPAHLYLEMAGEDLRKRAFLIEDPDGPDLCLRPDMTVPACREALARDEWSRGETFAVRYEGQVFRRRTNESSGASEFIQAGAEWFFRDPAIEPQIIATALESCRALGVEPQIKLGDVGVIQALVDACALPEPWGERVKRAFARPGGAAGVLTEALAPPRADTSPFGEGLAQLSEERAAQAVAEALAAARIPVIGGRGVGEIAHRLREKAARASGPRLDPDRIALIRSTLALEGAPDNVLATLMRMTRQPGMKLTAFAAAVEQAAARWAELQKLTRAPESARFVASLGRGLAYYDGFVFELEADRLGARAALGGGGRYDGLLHALARREGGRDVSGWGAAGFALRTKRLADARESEQT